MIIIDSKISYSSENSDDGRKVEITYKEKCCKFPSKHIHSLYYNNDDNNTNNDNDNNNNNNNTVKPVY